MIIPSSTTTTMAAAAATTRVWARRGIQRISPLARRSVGTTARTTTTTTLPGWFTRRAVFGASPSLSFEKCGSLRQQLQSSRCLATLSETDIKKRLDAFQDLFVEARLCIEDVNESAGTKYFEEDIEAATEAVNEAVAAFEALVAEVTDMDEKNRILRGNGLKVEQLKGELEMALHDGDDH
eukprot:scaffold5337_cov167-Amphora_coffeaeformis.AAC.8